MTKREDFIMKVIDAIDSGGGKTVSYKGRQYRITKAMSKQFKDKPISMPTKEQWRKLKYDNDYKKGGILPLIPIIAGIIGGVGAAAGGAAGITKAVHDKQAADKKQKEEERHNRAVEQMIGRSGKGLPEIIGTIKDFGKNFAKETRKTVKEGLLNLADKVQIEKQGIFLQPYKQGEGIFLGKHPGGELSPILPHNLLIPHILKDNLRKFLVKNAKEV